MSSSSTSIDDHQRKIIMKEVEVKVNAAEEEMKKIKDLPQGIYKAVFSIGNRNITRTIIKQ